jgi:hypothetical protein
MRKLFVSSFVLCGVVVAALFFATQTQDVSAEPIDGGGCCLVVTSSGSYTAKYGGSSSGIPGACDRASGC